MSMTRNQRRKYEDFMKAAGVQNIDQLGAPSPPPPSVEPEIAVIDTRQKKIKESEVSLAKPMAPQPKKARRIQKNVIKERQLKQRCDNIAGLQKTCPIDSKVQLVETSASRPKDQEIAQDLNASSTTLHKQEEKKTTAAVSKGIQRGFFFPSCVNKSQQRFYGYLGHCSILTKKPVVEGHYYLQVKLLKPSALSEVLKKQVQTSKPQVDSVYQPSVRVGIAKPNHKLLVPLGGAESYCLQCKNGNILYNREIVTKTNITFQPDDVIGMELRMSPPSPQEKSGKSPQRINEDSCLIFSKNGEEIGRVEGIVQGFYVMGVSIYNWANVQLNDGPDFAYAPSDPAVKAYSEIYEEQYLYKDLKFD